MPERPTTYQTRTNDDLKEAFLAVLARKPLADMTVAEVVREARVSRSTFYLHYNNLGEMYDAMVSEVTCRALPLINKCGCDCAPESGKTPFCLLLRENERYRPLFKESRFLETIFQNREAAEQSNLIAKLMTRGLDAQQARAIFSFQMSGCFTVSTMLGSSNADWPKIMKTLDTFIQGGLAALDAANPDHRMQPR